MRGATRPPRRAARRPEALRRDHFVEEQKWWLRSKRGEWVERGRVGCGVHRCCCGGGRSDRLALRLWRPQDMMCEAAHTMRVLQGTRGAVCTSTRRLNEASPKVSMTVEEQLPPARTVAGSAGGQVFTFVSRPGSLTLRESDDRGTTAPVLKPRRLWHRWRDSAFSEFFTTVPP